MNFSCLFLRRHQLLIHEIVAKQWRIREDILPGLHEHTTQVALGLNTEGPVGQTSYSQPSEATPFSPLQCSSPHQPVPRLLCSSASPASSCPREATSALPLCMEGHNQKPQPPKGGSAHRDLALGGGCNSRGRGVRKHVSPETSRPTWFMAFDGWAFPCFVLPQQSRT